MYSTYALLLRSEDLCNEFFRGNCISLNSNSPQTRIKQKGYTMLSTIVMTLLAIWLTLLIVGQIVGGYCGYKFFKAITNEDKK